MATTYPTTKQSIPNPNSTDLLENANAELDHDYQHATINDTIEALQDVVGLTGSVVNTSHAYKLLGVATGDKAVSLTGAETLTNKTLTAPQINMGSDATGDIYYRTSGGSFSRLAIGTTDQILAVQAGIPAWIANPSASDGSYSAKGVLQGLTDAATSGLTIASGVISVNSGTTANKIVKLDGDAKLPAVDGSQLTNLVSPIEYKNGQTTRSTATTGDQTIAHGLGRVPKMVRIIAIASSGAASYTSSGTYNGTTVAGIGSGTAGALSSSTYILEFNGLSGNNAHKARATIAIDATNITLTWTKDSSPTDTAYISWEVEG